MSTDRPPLVGSPGSQNNLPEKIIFGISFLGSLGLIGYQGFQQWSTPDESPSRWWIIGALSSTVALSIFGLFRSKQLANSHDYTPLDTHTLETDDLTELSEEVNKICTSLHLDQSMSINFSIQTYDLSAQQILLKIQKIYKHYQQRTSELALSVQEKDQQLQQLRAQKSIVNPDQTNLELQRKEKTLKRTQQDLESKCSEIESLNQELFQARVSMAIFEEQTSRLQILMEGMTNLGPNSPSHSTEIQSIFHTLANTSRSVSTNSSVYNSPAKPLQPSSKNPDPAFE